MFSNFANFHFVGIGGAGMSGLAHVLCKMGKKVSGSDMKESIVTKRLQAEGISVFIGHKAENILDTQVVVLSTAIQNDNEEYIAAKNAGKKIVHRSDIMAYIVNNHKAVAVAGAHGKTTTTAMLACIARHANLDATYLIGGDVVTLEGNAYLGNGEYAITEADESDASFLKIKPYMAIITNIEDDHLDFYKSKENINKAFLQFLDSLVDGGKAVVCYDNVTAKNIAKKSNKNIISYAIDNAAFYQAKNISFSGDKTIYDLYVKGQKLSEVVLRIPGKHNVLNSLAAIATALEMGASIKQILCAMAIFTGAKRRFEVKYKDSNIKIVDDYAHHPTEIVATIKAARQTLPGRIICVFQPHRYSRTQMLFTEFIESFADLDILILTDIYSAGENPIQGVSSLSLYEAIGQKYDFEVVYISELEDVPIYIENIWKQGDLVLTMGAGNVYTVGEKLADLFTK